LAFSPSDGETPRESGVNLTRIKLGVFGYSGLPGRRGRRFYAHYIGILTVGRIGADLMILVIAWCWWEGSAPSPGRWSARAADSAAESLRFLDQYRLLVYGG